jgi:hypothetical protein
MTRESQKREERAVVDQYVQLCGIACTVEEGEHPDFIVHTESGAIGVEVTAYHGQTGNVVGTRAREVESLWEGLQRYSEDFRERHTDFNRLSVKLRFRERRLPPPRDFGAFCSAVVRFLRRNPEAFPDRYLNLRPNAAEDTLLAEYLSHVTVHASKGYRSWSWPAYNSGGIGTSDDEMFGVVEKKLREYRAPGHLSESHLVVYGDGPGLSRVAAPVSTEQLAGFAVLNDALSNGPFGAFAILGLRNFRWIRTRGWQALGDAKP